MSLSHKSDKKSHRSPPADQSEEDSGGRGCLVESASCTGLISHLPRCHDQRRALGSRSDRKGHDRRLKAPSQTFNVQSSDAKTAICPSLASGRELRTLTRHPVPEWFRDTSGHDLNILNGYVGPVTGVALSGDGRIAFSAPNNNRPELWEVESGCTLRRLLGRADAVSVALRWH